MQLPLQNDKILRKYITRIKICITISSMLEIAYVILFTFTNENICIIIK